MEHLPASFGKYELLERIATGGMAEVFLARSFGVAGFEKRLVIKRIRPELAQDPRFISMFINEAKISVHLSHPNVVHVYDLGRVGASWYIAMEHLHGRDLTRLVKTLRARGERLPLPVSVAIVAEVCRGLAYAHSRPDAEGRLLGLVHRDVSPHNLLVTFTGEVKLVDFGIARLVNTAQARAAGLAPGRPGGGKYAYMSPEQARGDDVDHRTDIFSAGIVLWELLVGHRLFQDPDPAEKLRRVQEAVIPHPADEGIEVDDELWRILRKALARSREDRYSSAAVFEEDLRAWLFHAGHQVGRTEITACMHHAFPEDAESTPGELDLSRMVADVERLDAPQDTTGSTPARTSTDSSLPGRLRPSETEPKNVAVLVVDVDGLTDLSARVDPEVLFARHYQLLRWMRKVVDRYDGLVQRAVDDQVLILFGVPRTRLDDVDRALECAMELQRTVDVVNSKGLNVTLAIGVHSGEVTVGASRRNKVRYVARGNTTRFARRLSSVADHGQVLVSERIVRAAEGKFRLSRGPDVPNRGGRPADPSFLLVGRRSALQVRSTGPWLRRGPELDALRDALIELSHGRGSGVALLGGIGTGKSRLVHEIREVAGRRGLRMYVSRCTAFGDDAPLEPLRELFRQVVGVHREQPRAELVESIARLSQLGLSPAEVDVVRASLGVGETVPGLDEVWRALHRALVGLAEDGPVIVALDDLQHLGPSELGGFRRVVLANTDRPILFLCTWRGTLPDVLRGVLTEVELGPFGDDNQRRLVARLLDVDDVDDGITAVVGRCCEGNPLYVEEMIKYLVQDKRIQVVDGRAVLAERVDEPALPHSLAAVISSRIDALGPASKGTLQLAALMGPTFSTALLGEAAGVDDPTPLVTDLASHGLISRSRVEGDDQWTFASDLVREIAARGILGVQRRDYHRMIAAAIEGRAGEDRDAWADVLAHHCAKGGRLLDAARFAYTSGLALEKSQFLERARAAYQRGLRWITDAAQTPETWDARVQGEAMLHYRYGVVSLLLADTSRGERALQIALDIASESGLPWIEIRAHLELGKSYLHRGRNQLAQAHVHQARALLRIERDPELELEALEAAAYVAYETGRNDEAEALWSQALELAQDEPLARARCLVGLANRHIRAGHTAEANTMLEQALGAARDAGDRILEGRVLNNLGLLHSTAGRHDQALASFRRALEVREGIGYARGVAINHHNIGDVHFSRGDFARAHVAFERSRELAAEMGWGPGVLLNELYLGYVEAAQGQEEAGIGRMLSAIEGAQELGDGEIATTGQWLVGRWLAEHDRVDEARAQLQDALTEARRHDLAAMADEITAAIDAVGG